MSTAVSCLVRYSEFSPSNLSFSWGSRAKAFTALTPVMFSCKTELRSAICFLMLLKAGRICLSKRNTRKTRNGIVAILTRASRHSILKRMTRAKPTIKMKSKKSTMPKEIKWRNHSTSLVSRDMIWPVRALS